MHRPATDLIDMRFILRRSFVILKFRRSFAPVVAGGLPAILPLNCAAVDGDTATRAAVPSSAPIATSRFAVSLNSANTSLG